MTHTKATFGIYRSKEEINAAVALLSGLGFGEARASVLFPERAGAQDFPQVQQSQLFRFAKLGSMIGAAIFLVFGMLAVSGAIPFAPMENLDFTARVLAVVGSLVLGGVVGAACGTLVGIGTPVRAGHRYGQYVDSGGILLSVHSKTAEGQKRVEEILEKSGAQDITSVDEDKGWEQVMEETANLARVNLSRNTGHSSRPFSAFEPSSVQK